MPGECGSHKSHTTAFLNTSEVVRMALVRQFLSTVGDGTGTVNAAVDGSSVAANYKIVPASGREYRIDSLTVFLEDNAALLGDAFAGATMTNGIRIQVLNGDDVATLNVDAGLAI